MKNLRNQSFIVILPILAFIVYSILWDNVNMTTPDTIGYISVAKDISDGHIDSLNARTPGYPILLLLTGSSENSYPILFHVQLLMYVLSVIVLSSLLYELNVSRKLILVFSIISLLPYNVAMTTKAVSESLTVFTLVFGLFFLFKWLKQTKILYIVLSSLLFAYSAITRPTYQLILFVFIFIFIIGFPYFKEYKKKFISSVIAVGISSVIIIGSLFYINYTKFNYFGLTYLIGFNLCNKTVSTIDRLPDEYKLVKSTLIKYRNKKLLEEYSSHKGYNYIWDENAIPDLKADTNLDLADLSDYMKDLNLNLIINSPRRYIKEVGSSMAYHWLPYIKSESFFGSKIVLLVFIFIHFFLIISFFLSLILMFGLVFVSLFYKRKCKIINKNDELFLITLSVPLIIIFYTMFISSLIEAGDPRFRTVNDLFIYLFIFLSFSFIKGKIAEMKIQ